MNLPTRQVNSLVAAVARREPSGGRARLPLASVTLHAGGLVCAECDRKPRDNENPADEWRAYLDIDDDLPVFCPECAEREFGEEGRVEGGSSPPGDVWAPEPG
jgi:hypothetical protein